VLRSCRLGVWLLSIALRLALHLPRDAATVPLVRRLLDQALRTLGVVESCRDDIGLILTEACANVIEHALQIHNYEITIDVTGERCVIHVVNAGAVVDPSRLAASAHSASAHSASAHSASAHSAFPSPGSRLAAGAGSGASPDSPAFVAPVPAPGSSTESLSEPAAGGAGAPVPAARAPHGSAAADLLFDAVLDEHGRGLHIIRSLADELYLTPALAGGLVLQAVITLRWTADAEVWQRR
jgi:anti-sigma regulatory factor (Ser/Thr protein kinase)